jgi:hypothetical protein
VYKHPQPEHDRRQHATLAVRVQPESRAYRDDSYPFDLWGLAALPLPERQVGDVVTGIGKAPGEAPIPALGATDGVRVEAVVDEANTHDWFNETLTGVQ